VSGWSRAWRIVRHLLTVVGTAFVTLLALGLLFVLLYSLGWIRFDRGRARHDRATLEIGNLETAMKLHRAKTGHYPDSATGFAALIDLGIIDREPRDPWGNPFRYELVDGQPVIASFGADGVPAGEGDSADISSAPRLVARP
jgi:type II secretion system (T2SS) protein G